MDSDKILFDINGRLARIEGRMESLDRIERSLNETNDAMIKLRIRVAGIAGAISLVVSAAGYFAGKF